jgi:hypothetical protein
VPQVDLLVELVDVAAPHAASAQIALIDEVGHDALDGPLGDPHLLRHVAQPNLGVPGDSQQDEPVVRDEGPWAPRVFEVARSRSDGRMILAACVPLGCQLAS